MSKDILTPLQLLGRREDTQLVLEINTAEQVRQILPRRLRLAPSWNLLYSLDQDGTSMSTMYHKVKDKGPLILAIKDMNDQSIYLEENGSSSPKVKFYLWTGRNEYMILSEHNYLSVGGGDGRSALWIDSDFERGHSSCCDTFDNEILSSDSEFDCIGFEVWGFKN
ncbi:10854_t:CDS:2 [Entrophospora sp. SA101]|nr:14347_t:CDS:2 [Entrophospora sp. SA101]CAJ0637073.1 10854_t:CDS:2 [Entrophospora sp. SA101]CAJ0837482.1 2040_t:CDS:2 [Entrophospora sp. SA101]CAJ0909349.1 769_t:CDS:2 [Entrophospora sp. SA101]